MERWYVLKINPEPWAIGPVGFSRRGGKMSAYVGRNQQLDAYKEAVREEVGNVEMLKGKLSVTFYFWRNRAEYKTPQARIHRKHEADATNLQKSTEDALQGVLYANDKDNHHVQSFIVEQGPDVEGRVVVCVKECPDFNTDDIPSSIWAEIDDDGVTPYQPLFNFDEDLF